MTLNQVTAKEVMTEVLVLNLSVWEEKVGMSSPVSTWLWGHSEVLTKIISAKTDFRD